LTDYEFIISHWPALDQEKLKAKQLRKFRGSMSLDSIYEKRL